MTMLRIISTILFTLMSVSFASAQIKSVYTGLTSKNCREFKSDPKEDFLENSCRGFGGYKIHLLNIDSTKVHVDVIGPSGKRYSIIPSGFMVPSTIGDRAEWRVKNGKPVAL